MGCPGSRRFSHDSAQARRARVAKFNSEMVHMVGQVASDIQLRQRQHLDPSLAFLIHRCSSSTLE